MIEKIVGLFRYDPDAPMVFNSGLFLFLFPVFMVCYYLLRERGQWRVLYVLMFSYYFYYKSSGIFFLLLLFTSLLDYGLAWMIYRSGEVWKKRLLVAVSVAINIGILGYFKYTNLFGEIWSQVSGSEFLPLEIILPVGISFFTFQSLSYTIDVYRGQVEPLRRFTDFAFYVSFFPQLVAGPIVRARDFIPQMLAKITVTHEMFGRGVFLILTGLFKKAVISDYISINFVDRIFDAPSLYSGVENLMAVYGYALQIYCDFSGYSDMAIGIALLLGFRFKMNFNSPYKSQSVTEFWQRWHISLSTWLRDYLYIPLGGSRKGAWRTYTNLLATMLLGGLWHGASLRFLFWGGWHGAWLVIERLWKQTKWKRLETGIVYVGGQVKKRSVSGYGKIIERTEKGASGLRHKNKAQAAKWLRKAECLAWWLVGYFVSGIYHAIRILWWCVCQSVVRFLGWWHNSPLFRRLVGTVVTFHIVCLGWIFFRASSFLAAWEMIRQIFTSFRGHLFGQWLTGYDSVAALMLLGYVVHFLPDRLDNSVCAAVVRSPLVVKAALLAAVIFFVMQIKSSEILPFIYFQF